MVQLEDPICNGTSEATIKVVFGIVVLDIVALEGNEVQTGIDFDTVGNSVGRIPVVVNILEVKEVLEDGFYGYLESITGG